MSGVLFNLLTKAVEGREQQKGTAEVLGENKGGRHHNKRVKYVPKRGKK